MSMAAFDNRVTRALGIRYPIVQGGMQWVATAKLASAVATDVWNALVIERSARLFAVVRELELVQRVHRALVERPATAS